MNSINQIVETLLNTVKSLRTESGLSRGYSAFFKYEGVVHSATADNAQEIASEISDSDHTREVCVFIAPSRKKDAIKISQFILFGEENTEDTETPQVEEKAKETPKVDAVTMQAAKAKAVDLGIGEVPFGAFVWWNMRNIKVTPEVARHVVVDTMTDSCSPDLVSAYVSRIKDIDANAVLVTEGKKWKWYNDDNKWTCGIADQTDTTITFGIKQNVVHEVKGKKRNDDLQVETVVWDFNSRSFIAGGSTDASARFIADMTDKCIYHQTKGIRPVVQEMVQDMGAISLKDQGGFYLVAMDAANPDLTLERLSAIRAFVASFGNSQMMIATQSTESAREACEDDVKDHLSAEVVELEEKVDRWIASTKNTASDALERAMTDFGALRAKSRMFAAALEMRASDLVDRIDRMEKAVEAMQARKEESNGRTVTDATLIVVKDLLESGVMADGDIFVDIADIEDAGGLHESSYDIAKAVNHWKRLTSGGKAARHYGYRGVELVAFNAKDEPVDVDSDQALDVYVRFTKFGSAVESLNLAEAV